MIKRRATAVWEGSGKEGAGHVSTQSTVLDKTQYSFNARFAEGKGTNPEELIAAAHAGCFSMKLSFVLGEAGFTPKSIQTECVITLGDGIITNADLSLKANVPGISKEKFEECATNAKTNCPISKSLNPSINISLKAELI